MNDIDLTEIQNTVVKYCNKKCMVHEKYTKHLVLEKLYNLGYNKNDYFKIKNYINKCSMTVHVKENTLLNNIIYDGRIKNIHEINNQKISWIYDK